ncbi:MAG: 50S ribosomal protein L9 [Chloroflexota bacterium]
MKVLLKEDVDNLGYAGEVHNVSAGFGRNFLIPKGFAVVASDGVMKQAEVWRRKAEARREQIRSEHEALAARITGLVLSFEARAGDNGRLFGSITTSQIADEMNESLGTDIDRRKVGIEPLRQLGEHKVVVRLSGEFQPEMTVNITSEDAEDELPEELTTPVEMNAGEEDATSEEEAASEEE